MSEKQDWFKRITGEKITERYPKKSYEQIINKQKKKHKSQYGLLNLGTGTDGEFWLTEEERENHLHIIGSTGEGKSKFLELLIRHDIDSGNGLLFLDPSDQAETAYNVLKYCAKVGHKKVVLIDPSHRWKFNKVPGLNPFHYIPSLEFPCVSNITDIVRVVFGSKSEDTPTINKYLPAILHTLFKAHMSLAEAIYFTDRENTDYYLKRSAILNFSHAKDRFRMALEEVYKDKIVFNEIRSTVRRFEPLFHEILVLMLAKGGINFMKLVREKYVVLVNLSTDDFDYLHNKLLATLLINELMFAISRLRQHDWKGVYYLYIDEAGEYANRKLAELMAYKRKSGLRVNTAHQYFSQFEDKYVLDAVNNLTKTKIAFHIPSPEDRMKVVKMMYGGDLADREVSYVLSKQESRHAVIKKGKEPPAIIKIKNIDELDITKEELENYIHQIYEQPFYFDPQEVRKEIYARVQPTKADNSSGAAKGTQADNKTGGKTDKRAWD